MLPLSFADNCHKTAFGFKKGTYLKYYKQLKDIFPNAKFIHIIRDGRAVFNSKKNSIYSVTGKPFETNALRAAKVWKEKVLLSKKVNDLYQDTSIIIHYENLILDTDQTLSEILEFLDLDYLNAKKSNLNYKVPLRYGNLHENIRKKPLKSRINSWKEELSKQELKEYEYVAGTILNLEGYSLCNFHLDRIERLKLHSKNILIYFRDLKNKIKNKIS